MHSTEFGPGGAYCFFVAVDATWVSKRLERCEVDGATPRIATGANHLQSFALKMYEEFKNPDSLSELIVESALLELMGRWFRGERDGYRDAPGWLRSVKTLLQDTFRESISLSDLSQAVGVHSSHIAREFKRAYSCTVGEYIRKLRVDFVAEKLRTSGKGGTSLTDLALQAGFSSHAHMSSVFRSVTGMTPSQYQKAHQITSIW
jgi:AraC family transcriptional regulator